MWLSVLLCKDYILYLSCSPFSVFSSDFTFFCSLYISFSSLWLISHVCFHSLAEACVNYFLSKRGMEF
jgi:hypothetical protein